MAATCVAHRRTREKMQVGKMPAAWNWALSAGQTWGGHRGGEAFRILILKVMGSHKAF